MEAMLHQMVRNSIDAVNTRSRRMQNAHDDLIEQFSAYRILIHTELTNAIKAYCDEVGLTDYARDFIMSKENNIQPGERLYNN